jgi:nucleoporin SEH1
MDKQKVEAVEIASFSDHGAAVWRVEWNITGTILASSGDDGTVRLWKPNFDNQWKCLSVITSDQDSTAADTDDVNNEYTTTTDEGHR